MDINFYRQLVDGVETLRKIEQVPTSYEKPLRRIVIARCGEYFFGEEPEIEAGPDAFVVGELRHFSNFFNLILISHARNMTASYLLHRWKESVRYPAVTFILDIQE